MQRVLLRVCAVVILFAIVIACVFLRNSPFFSLYLGGVLLLMVGLLPLVLEGVKWYEPVVFFSAMMSLFSLDVIYMAATGFSRAEHVIHFVGDIVPLADQVIIYAALWNLIFFLGYALIRKVTQAWGCERRVSIPKFHNGFLVLTAICLCFFIGLSNLIYNIYLFNPGHPVEYLFDFGISRYRVQENEGRFTTLGYNFFIVSLVLCRFYVRKWSLTAVVGYSCIAFFCFLALLSRGQVFYTFSIFIFVFLIEYFVSSHRKVLEVGAVVMLPFMVFGILLAYALRIVSVEAYLAEGRGADFVFLDVLGEKMLSMLDLIFAKGNVPNLPAMIVFWEHYGQVEPYVNGASFISWLGAFIPNITVAYLGTHISDVWYPNNVGGIPPGVMFEAYANFGGVGALLVAFIFGCLAAITFNIFMSKRSVFIGVIYAALITRFWFMLPKVESAVLSNAIWLFMPSVVVLFLMLIADKVISKCWVRKGSLSEL